MTRIALVAAGVCMAGCVALGFSTSGGAAELVAPRAHVAEAMTPCDGIRPCRPVSCRLDHRCRPLCPDGYSCYPLYGAYGPYGGMAYWDAYTGGSWEYRR
jgi:hypothetical protein